MKTRKLWIAFILVMVVSFGILGYYDREIYRKAPPVPDKVISESGKVLFTEHKLRLVKMFGNRWEGKS